MTKSKAKKPENRVASGFARKRGNPNIAKEGKATRFKPGISGNPGGRPAIKPVLAELRRQLAEDANLLPEVVANAINRARATGDVAFFKELRDMLDGKPAPTTTDPDGEALPVPQVAITFVGENEE